MRLAWVFVLLALAGARAQAEGVRLLFGGDVMTGRGVGAEALARGTSPFAGLAALGQTDLFVANLEGTAGERADCIAAEPCLVIPPAGFDLLARSGMTAFSLANNHAGDAGAAGRARTLDALARRGIVAAPSAEQPTFLRAGGLTIGLVALTLIAPRDRPADAVPSRDIARRIQLARALSDVAVVFIHWGAELRDWPQPSQQAAARWLVAQGADLIVGAHPHVPIPPDCIDGVPVFWSLGNLVFDQSDPETRHGQLADCRVVARTLSCTAIGTAAALGTSFPHPTGPEPGELSHCTRPLTHGLEINGFHLRGRTAPGGAMTLDTQPGWSVPVQMPLVSAWSMVLAHNEPASLVMLQRSVSRIDGEDGLRLFVYRVGPGGLAPRWRGSALGWPLVDARILPGDPDLLCALHRTDSFIAQDATAAATRVATWRWNGFGFTLDEHQGSACAWP